MPEDSLGMDPVLEVVTELSATGHVYVKFLDPVGRAAKSHWEHSTEPGTLGSVGKWSFFREMTAVHEPHCSCNPTFLCPGCDRRVGACLGASDDYPELCDDCWNSKQTLEKFLAPRDI